MALTALMVPIVSLHQRHVLRLSRRAPPCEVVAGRTSTSSIGAVTALGALQPPDDDAAYG
jgi:hypothetical protein